MLVIIVIIIILWRRFRPPRHARDETATTHVRVKIIFQTVSRGSRSGGGGRGVRGTKISHH